MIEDKKEKEKKRIMTCVIKHKPLLNAQIKTLQDKKETKKQKKKKFLKKKKQKSKVKESELFSSYGFEV